MRLFFANTDLPLYCFCNETLIGTEGVQYSVFWLFFAFLLLLLKCLPEKVKQQKEHKTELCTPLGTKYAAFLKQTTF